MKCSSFKEKGIESHYYIQFDHDIMVVVIVGLT